MRRVLQSNASPTGSVRSGDYPSLAARGRHAALAQTAARRSPHAISRPPRAALGRGMPERSPAVAGTRAARLHRPARRRASVGGTPACR
ncbi:MAG: hypothetical protein AB7P69_27055 [Candidatus Binatia bacterium]